MTLRFTSVAAMATGLAILGSPSATFAQESCGPYRLERTSQLVWPGAKGVTIVRLAGEIVFDGRGHKGANEIVERNCDIDLAELNDQASVHGFSASVGITEFENYGTAINAYWFARLRKPPFGESIDTDPARPGLVRLHLTTGVRDGDGFLKRLSYDVVVEVQGFKPHK
jgi:hypothetical protein